MRRMVLRATCWKSTLALVVISPASTTRLSFTSVSAATRERGSWARIASSTASEIWSATLSGWPSETDSEVKRCSLIVLYRLGEIGSEETARISNNLASIPRFSPRIAAKLPLRVLHAVGTVLGWAVYGISPTYRRHLRENLALAGYHDARTRRATIAAMGQMVAELPALWFRPQAEVAALVRATGGAAAEALAAMAQRRPVLFFAPHMGS